MLVKEFRNQKYEPYDILVLLLRVSPHFGKRQRENKEWPFAAEIVPFTNKASRVTAAPRSNIGFPTNRILRFLTIYIRLYMDTLYV